MQNTTKTQVTPDEHAVRRRFYCLDCGFDTYYGEYYMLADKLWLQANPKIDGMLCIGCVEKRLGRKLKKEDFINCPLNSFSGRFTAGGWPYRTKRLIDRQSN